MIKELVTDTDILSTPCEAATAEDAQVAADLAETLKSLENAACLAANQIGITKRIVAFKDLDDNIHVLFNPSMKQALHASKQNEECLTLPEGTVNSVKRFGWIKVAYEELIDGKLVARKREYQGWVAEIIQHMIDHCNGKLI